MHFSVHRQKDDGRYVLSSTIWNHEITYKTTEGEGGNYVLKFCFNWSFNYSRWLEDFLVERNVCYKDANLDLSNLVKWQHIYQFCKKIDESCGSNRTKDPNQLGCNNF